MKRLIIAAAVLAAAPLFATDVSSANTFGVLKVTPAGSLTIISVPWVAVGGGVNVNPNELVMASNRANGDTLWYYSGSDSSYKCWVHDGTGWQAAASSSTHGGITSAAAAAVDTVQRGGALIVEVSETANPIYLYGQYVSGNGTSTIAASACNLIAPPNNTAASGLDMNGASKPTFSTTPDPTDYIEINSKPGRKYRYDSSTGWGYNGYNDDGTGEYGWHQGLTIPAGEGAWYMRNADSTMTITW